MVQVAAALIRRDNTFMICRRPPHKARGNLWEFVGGKSEKGETLPETLKRECMEELDAKIEVDDIYMEVDHIYPDISIHLTLFNARLLPGEEPKMIEHTDIKFITAEEIGNYEFCPADKDILEKIKKEGF